MSSVGVLAVTDDLAFRSRIELGLRGAGIKVSFVTAEKLALALAGATPALVLLDYSLCGAAGWATVETMKRGETSRRVPVVAYGPHMDLAGRDRAKEAGVDEVVSNSQIASQLVDIVRRHLSDPGGDELIRLGHSPDPDDAFMFYPLADGKLDTQGLRFEQVLRDIETLNRMALDGDIEITAASVHAYAYLADRYSILPCGGSFGDGYGPILVSPSPLSPSDLKGKMVAIPGELTSACLALRLYAGDVETKVVPFDEIPSHLLQGKSDAGVLIHEGQLTYARSGLHKVVDLGEWWKRETGLPLPLGVNLVRKDMGEARCKQVARLLRDAIEYSLAHREKALTYAMQFGRGLERELTDRFVGMYVNDLTREAGSSGRRAIAQFLERGHAAQILPHRVTPEFVDY
ncbi:MAG TPA: MqnA/MqnD/SBP family protein [Candidatus Polarisedimenticolia bacterium]|nr:MqnA/MqnD/SBP family protein [Candidatus Polarisedimenticolia bacterium]